MVRTLSGNLRSKIALKKGKLQSATTIAQACHDTSVMNKDKTAQVKLVNDSEDAIAKLEVAITSLEESDTEWTSLLFKLTDQDEIDAENVLYENTSQGPNEDGYLYVLEEAKVLQHLLKLKVDKLKRPPKQTPPAPVVAAAVSAAPVTPPAAKSKAVKLPPMPLPRFSGDPLQWSSFWSVFDATVGDSDLSEIQKYNYLIQQCEGIAHSAISRMQVTDTSYQDAVTILKERFQRDNAEIQATLFSEIKRLPQASKHADIRQNHDALHRIFLQLSTFGCDVDASPGFNLEVWAKYSANIVKELIQRYNVSYTATPTQIQTAVGNYLRDTELLESLYTEVKPFVPQSKSDSSKSRTPYGNKYESQSSPNPSAGAGGRRESATPTSALVASEKPITPSSAKSNAKSKSPPPCQLCKGEHFNSDCTVYPTVSTRKQRLKEVGRCTQCFSLKHDASACDTPAKYFRCFYCNDKTVHKSALCPTKFPDASSSQTSAAVAGDKKSTKIMGTCSMGANENALLLTAVTTITNPINGAAKRVRVMLDTGSHRSFVTQSLLTELECEVSHDESLQIAVFGSKRTWDVRTARVNLNLSTRSSGQMELVLNVIPLITECYFGPGKLPESVQQRIKAMDYAMADTFDPEIGPPDVLIGSEYFWQFIRGEPMPIGSALFLVPTTLGLILSGSYQSDEPHQQATLVCLTERTAQRCISASLEAISMECRGRQPSPDVDDFWSLEKIGITDSPHNNDDEKALNPFNETIQFSDGRYQVCWPWNDQKTLLKSNYQLALGRLQSLGKRLSTSPRSAVDEYERVINYQAEAGIIERVPDAEARNPKHITHYLPHHPVVRTDHETTKVRIVYDASAKCGKDNVSLNECMYRGPILLPDLCSILIRFRLNPVAIASDIEKAFLQIGIQQTERDVTRFLWFSDVATLDAKNPMIYRFTRVPFGIICSPFILMATVSYHLENDGSEVSKVLIDDIYVDNVITGTTDVTAALSVYHEAKRIFNDVSMNLRGWCSNSEDLMDAINADDRSTKRSVKVLGLIWNSEIDQLRLHCDWSQRRTCRTKRQVLQAIASVYDPLGLFQPCTLDAKCFLRKLWLDKHGWDDEITEELQNKWKAIHSSIRPIFDVSLPRFIDHPPGSTTIVAFCDASKEAYATAVYLRSTPPDSTTSKCTLVYAKSRLAPKSNTKETAEISIPKLELLGIVIASTAAQFVRKSINVPSSTKVFVLSDSTIALTWLQSKKPLPIFIHNRVKKIKQLEDAEFHHVSGPENPADLLTRGVTGSEIEGCQFWWHGPPWLENDCSQWPTDVNTNSVTSEELRDRDSNATNPVYHTFLAGEDLRISHYPFKIDPTTFSSFRNLFRVTARCYKFLKQHLWDKLDPNDAVQFPVLNQLFQNATTEVVISSKELNQSKQVWIKAAQQQELADVFKALEGDKQHSLLKQLSVYKDDEGMLRCFGRFGYSDLSFESVRPLILPKKCHLTNLIITDVHERLFHAGISHTLSQIRRQYWIPHGRNAIRKVINRCLVCRKLNGAPYALPGMPPWPRERIARSSPFQFTGVNYLGPINVTVLDTVQKMWVSLFTCLATRAIHLECVEDCTVTSFIDCISRFISRRGAPAQIISDNAPQFRLSKTLFDRTWAQILHDPAIITYVSDKGIEWKSTTALAPWQGGFYERLVGIVKSSFKSVVGRRLLKREEFITVIAEIEAIVNSRPLTYVCSDAKSGLALRPMDFIVDRPTGTPTVNDTLRPEGGDASKVLLRYWKAKQRRINVLWNQFYNDYLLSLRERYQTKHRNKRCDVHASPRLNEVVLVKNADNTPRGTWKLGKITKIIPSRDNQIRSVELQLPNQQIIERSIAHLYPLEVQTEATTINNDATDLDDSPFDGFNDSDLAAIPQHLQFLNNAVLDVTTVCASTRCNVLASLTTTAVPVLC